MKKHKTTTQATSHKSFIIVSLVIVITAVTFVAYRLYSPPISGFDVEFVLPGKTISAKTAPSLQSFETEKPGFLPEEELELVVEVDNDINDNEAYEDSLLDIYKRLSGIEKKLSALTKEVSFFKIEKTSLRSTPLVSILLIELYKLKNIALSGVNFEHKTKEILALKSKNLEFNRLLNKLAQIKIIATDEKIKLSLENLENEYYKQKSNQEVAPSFFTKLKVIFFDFVKIKKVKNFKQGELGAVFQEVYAEILLNNYKKIAEKTEIIHKNITIPEEIRKEIEHRRDFDIYIKQAIGLIL